MNTLQIAAWVELGVCWIAWSLAFVKPRKQAAGAKKNVSVAGFAMGNPAGDAGICVHLGICAASGI